MADYKADLAAIHCAKKEAGLDDGAYRDFLFRHTGQHSAKGLKTNQRRAVLIAFSNLTKPQKKDQPKRAGSRPLAEGPHAAKLRALWLSAYHLGIVFDPSEQALDKWATSATGVESLRWNSAKDMSKAIEGLKSWIERAMGVPFDAEAALDCKLWVITQQWQLLAQAGEVDKGPGNISGQCHYYSAVVGRLVRSLNSLSLSEADRIIEALGRKVRKLKAAERRTA